MVKKTTYLDEKYFQRLCQFILFTYILFIYLYIYMYICKYMF